MKQERKEQKIKQNREREREKNRQDGSQVAPVDYLPPGHEDA